MVWVKVTNVKDGLIAPVIEAEPVNPNGEGKWYKRTEKDEANKVKVTITSNSESTYAIQYIASGAHNEKHDETNPVIRESNKL